MDRKKFAHGFGLLLALATPIVQVFQEAPPNVPKSAIMLSALVGIATQWQALFGRKP